MKWRDVSHDEQVYHVVPVGDLKPHVERGVFCWCDPKVERVGKKGTLVTHNSADGRELIERHGLQ